MLKNKNPERKKIFEAALKFLQNHADLSGVQIDAIIQAVAAANFRLKQARGKQLKPLEKNEKSLFKKKLFQYKDKGSDNNPSAIMTRFFLLQDPSVHAEEVKNALFTLIETNDQDAFRLLFKFCSNPDGRALEEIFSHAASLGLLNKIFAKLQDEIPTSAIMRDALLARAMNLKLTDFKETECLQVLCTDDAIKTHFKDLLMAENSADFYRYFPYYYNSLEKEEDKATARAMLAQKFQNCTQINLAHCQQIIALNDELINRYLAYRIKHGIYLKRSLFPRNQRKVYFLADYSPEFIAISEGNTCNKLDYFKFISNDPDKIERLLTFLSYSDLITWLQQDIIQSDIKFHNIAMNPFLYECALDVHDPAADLAFPQLLSLPCFDLLSFDQNGKTLGQLIRENPYLTEEVKLTRIQQWEEAIANAAGKHREQNSLVQLTLSEGQPQGLTSAQVKILCKEGPQWKSFNLLTDLEKQSLVKIDRVGSVTTTTISKLAKQRCRTMIDYLASHFCVYPSHSYDSLMKLKNDFNSGSIFMATLPEHYLSILYYLENLCQATLAFTSNGSASDKVALVQEQFNSNHQQLNNCTNGITTALNNISSALKNQDSEKFSSDLYDIMQDICARLCNRIKDLHGGSEVHMPWGKIYSAMGIAPGKRHFSDLSILKLNPSIIQSIAAHTLCVFSMQYQNRREVIKDFSAKSELKFPFQDGKSVSFDYDQVQHYVKFLQELGLFINMPEEKARYVITLSWLFNLTPEDAENRYKVNVELEDLVLPPSPTQFKFSDDFKQKIADLTEAKLIALGVLSSVEKETYIFEAVWSLLCSDPADLCEQQKQVWGQFLNGTDYLFILTQVLDKHATELERINTEMILWHDVSIQNSLYERLASDPLDELLKSGSALGAKALDEIDRAASQTSELRGCNPALVPLSESGEKIAKKWAYATFAVPHIAYQACKPLPTMHESIFWAHMRHKNPDLYSSDLRNIASPKEIELLNHREVALTALPFLVKNYSPKELGDNLRRYGCNEALKHFQEFLPEHRSSLMTAAAESKAVERVRYFVCSILFGKATKATMECAPMNYK